MNMLTLCAAAIALASCASAQSFNDAPPNARGQRPSFSKQTRAPEIADDVALASVVIADGLQNPWGLDQLPDGGWIVTERPGRMRIVSAQGVLSAPIRGLPEVDARRQGGLLDVLIAPDFDSTSRVWWSYAEPRGNGLNGTSVATGVLSEDRRTMTDVQVIFQQMPGWASTMHYGSRLVWGADGALFVTTGERSLPEARMLAQDVTTHIGKILRIDPMGGAAAGNPDIEGAAPEIWSWGHRNVQAAALGPDGELWAIEHGPRGGDELNHILPGCNYGWPFITYGEDYSGRPIGNGITASEGMEQPVYYWDPVIAPSGMDFYDGDMFTGWRGSILVGGLASQALVRLTLEDRLVTGEARYLQGQGRVRDVDVASDGSVMILTDAENGALIRVTPAK